MESEDELGEGIPFLWPKELGSRLTDSSIPYISFKRPFDMVSISHNHWRKQGGITKIYLNKLDMDTDWSCHS